MDIETQELKQARQRASVKWLLSKAFNNRIPDNLKEPFYRDHESQEHLKPQIVVAMGNATLYCQTLSNLYSDPNYQSLNHWSILQTLARKGVPVGESPELPLTETVLIQTNPLRINAHMSVIESLMILYSKEISSGERISNSIRRISGTTLSTAGLTNEQSLLSWISHACAALKKRIDQEIENGATDENGVRLQSPDIPLVRDFQDLCDGVCLALLISYYCPKVVPWTCVRINYLPAVEDSIHNVLLVSNFSQKHLPYSVFHMTPEDITYMRGSMKQNLVVLLADLFNLFEIHPAKCVCYPGMDSQDFEQNNSGVGAVNEHGIVHRRGLTCQPVTPIPDLRSGIDTPSSSPSNRPPFQVVLRSPSGVIMRKPSPPKEHQLQQQSHNIESNCPTTPTGGGDEGGFVVHKSKGVTTLSSMQEPLVPARLRQAKEKNNMESKADERGDSIPAGRPSNWEQHRRPSFAGRRSRRNSSSEDSQLTIENFGGSQDQINMIGRSIDRERKTSTASMGYEPVVAVRSSQADARGTLKIGYDTDSGSEKQDRETEKTAMKRQTSMDNISLRNAIHSSKKDLTDVESPHQNHSVVVKQQSSAYENDEMIPKRKTSFANLPTNTTTWQQQSILLNQNDRNDYGIDNTRPLVDATKLSTIRMKLEEKRRHIELEKRKMEVEMSKHQEKVGKAAFLQAITKGKTQSQNDAAGENKDQPVDDNSCCSSADGDDSLPYKSNIIQDDDKWEPQNELKRNSDVEPIEIENYQQSIAKMNSNLQDIQQDIHRLTTQQTQIQAQHLQAQQLIQAQQIANMLNQQQPAQQQQQQPYGSQQHLPNQYRTIQQQHQQPLNFGSTPHLPQSYGSPNTYTSRPPSRDPYQQQQQQQNQIQYINDHGQYVNQQQTSTSPYPNSHQSPPIYQRENSQIYMGIIGHENGGGNNIHNNNNNYNNLPYGNHAYSSSSDISSSHQPLPPQNQYQSNQFINNRPNEYDDYQQQQHHNRIGGGGGRDHNSPQPNQFYLHESSPQPPTNTVIPQVPQRRTWAQSAASQQQQINDHQSYQQPPHQQSPQPILDVNAWQSQTTISPKLVDTRTWKSTGNSQGTSPGFMLHQNGGGDYNYQEKTYQNLFPVHASPQHSRTPPRQLSNIMSNHRDNININPVQPTDEMIMAPQSISFIGDDDDSVDQIEMNIETILPSSRRNNDYNHSQGIYQQQQQQFYGHDKIGVYDSDINLGKLNISSGNRTYRIPSPSRPSINANSFQDPQQDDTNEKGFYISFDDQPKRPKPPLRTKRSPKKEKSMDIVDKCEKMSQLENELDNNIKTDEKHNSNNLHTSNIIENNKSKTYNKLESSDSPVQLRQITEMNQMSNINHNNTNNNGGFTDYRRHLEDVTNQQIIQQQQQQHNSSSRYSEPKEKALVIGTELSNLDPDSVDEMEKKKEKIMLLSLQRRQQQEEAKARKEIETMQRREKEREKEDERERKKQEQMARRAAILETHRLKKAVEEAEREGKTLDKDIMMKHHHQISQMTSAPPRLRTQKVIRPRPKTIHVETGSVKDISEASSLSSRGKKGSSSNLTGYGQLSSNSMRRDYYRGSQDSLAIRESPDEYPSTSSTPIGRRGSYKNSREPTLERGRTLSRISIAKGSSLNFRGRKSNSLMNLCDTDSGLGRATPPRRAPSPGMGPSSTSTTGRHMPSPSGPGSLPPGLMSKRRVFDDGSSDISTASSIMEYSGPKLYKQPAAKSNRGIILNAVEYCVFPGAVNRDAKQKVLEKIARSEAKHFLILFRDAGCQFRALYSYWPENEQIIKLYGTGPSQVDEVMFDKFFKYNSGGKCFSQVHTKHLTVTIDAFTIHNSLWQGKKVNLPSKKDMALVI